MFSINGSDLWLGLGFGLRVKVKWERLKYKNDLKE